MKKSGKVLKMIKENHIKAFEFFRGKLMQEDQ
jgi:phage regulator Rha-like protein